jgi:hypothetical protein
LNAIESLGYLASLLVLAAFCMRAMVPLRVLSIMSNLAFIGYAVLAGVQPVLMLHAVLLPMNLWRLFEVARHREPDRRSPGPTAAPAAAAPARRPPRRSTWPRSP